MSGAVLAWVPAGMLALGSVLALGVNTQETMALRESLPSVVPVRLEGYMSQDVVISAEEQRVAGMTDYLMRVYSPVDASAASPEFSLYVGYYESQVQGKTIHSPKNCLPGAGWESLTSTTADLRIGADQATVNRYLLQNGKQRALVLYWYQGRGRIENSEYSVKWDLLRDAALHGRSEEALVRVIVPVVGSEEEAFQFASRAAVTMIPAINQALPTWSSSGD